jgi:hypothetical protein
MHPYNECVIEDRAFGFPMPLFMVLAISTVHETKEKISTPSHLLLPALTFSSPLQISNPASSINTSYLSHTACGLRVRLRTLDCGRVEQRRGEESRGLGYGDADVRGLQSLPLTYCGYPALNFHPVSMYFGVYCFFLYLAYFFSFCSLTLDQLCHIL